MYRGVFSPTMLLFAYNLNFYVSKIRKTVTVDVFLRSLDGKMAREAFLVFVYLCKKLHKYAKTSF